MPVYRVCVAYLLREHEGRRQVLLGRKKRGLGTGHWVGLGGKLEPGEGVQEAVVREIAEESGVEVLASDLDRRGDLLYLFPHRESWSQRSTVFVVTAWRGDPAESDELVPRWFDLDELPLDEMWDDASHWLPGVLAGGRVTRTFVFAADLSTVASDAPLPAEHAGP